MVTAVDEKTMNGNLLAALKDATPTERPGKTVEHAAPAAMTLDFKSPETLRLMRDTVARGTTELEFALFLEFAKSTGLNPFKREIWCIKTNSGLQIMTGINGYMTVANNHPAFDGMETEVTHDDKGNLVSAVARVWRKDRRFPSTGTALAREFMGQSPIWRRMPSHMLLKVAKSIAIREAFPQELGGTYTAEEMPPEYSLGRAQEPVDVTPPPPPPEPEPGPKIVPDWSRCRFRIMLPEKGDIPKVHALLTAKSYLLNPEDGYWYGDDTLPSKLNPYVEENPEYDFDQFDDSLNI